MRNGKIKPKKDSDAKFKANLNKGYSFRITPENSEQRSFTVTDFSLISDIGFKELFESYITHYPFKGEFHMYYYSKFMNGKPKLEELHKLEAWYKENKNGVAAEILKRNKEVNLTLNKEHKKFWANERGKTKLMVPTLNSLENPISMFDNNEQ